VAPVARAAPAGLAAQAARAAVPARADPASGSAASGRPAPTSTGPATTGPPNMGPASTTRARTGPARTGPSSSTGPGNTGLASTDLASTGLSRARRTSTGHLDRLAQGRADPVRSRQDRRPLASTARRTPTARPDSLIPALARIPMPPDRTPTAPDRRYLASRAGTTARDRQAGPNRDQRVKGPGPPAGDRWGLARATARGNRAVAAAARVTMGAVNHNKGRTALGIPIRAPTGPGSPGSPARGGRARARDRAGRARAGGRLPGSGSQALATAARAIPVTQDASATRRLAAARSSGPVAGTRVRGIRPAAR
jgi:hypothetical protein